MARDEKLLDRFLGQPRDFTWDELVRLLGGFGYAIMKSGRTSGSVTRFTNADGRKITVHRPHPDNIIKPTAMRKILTRLQEDKLI